MTTSRKTITFRSGPQNEARYEKGGGGGELGLRALAGCSDFSACVGSVVELLLWWWMHTYLPATPAVGVGRAGRLDDMVVSDKDENKDTAEEEGEKEADNVKEDETKEEAKEEEEKENEGREDTAAAGAEAELELSR